MLGGKKKKKIHKIWRPLSQIPCIEERGGGLGPPLSRRSGMMLTASKWSKKQNGCPRPTLNSACCKSCPLWLCYPEEVAKRRRGEEKREGRQGRPKAGEREPPASLAGACASTFCVASGSVS